MPEIRVADSGSLRLRLRHDGRFLVAEVSAGDDGDSMWTATLSDSEQGTAVCRMIGWIARMPAAIAARLGWQNHLRVMSTQTPRKLLGRGYAHCLLEFVSHSLSLPVEPPATWAAIERYSRWEWLDRNRGTLTAEQLLLSVPAGDRTAPP